MALRCGRQPSPDEHYFLHFEEANPTRYGDTALTNPSFATIRYGIIYGNGRKTTSGLADEVVLYTKTRKFHWNVSGESFMELHLLFEKQYKELKEAIDEIAERISKLGGKTIGTMHEFLELAHLSEAPGKYPTRKEMIKELLDDHESIVKKLRKDIDECSDAFKDAGTADFLTGLMEDHETNSWKLRRYLD